MSTPGILILAALALAATPVAALAQDSAAARYISAAEITERLARPVEGTVNFALPTGPEAVVLAARRDRAGEVELHKSLNDEFVVQSGHATVLVGGQVSGNHQTAPGEWRGGQITGGAPYRLGPGDALWIPAGQPHQVTPAPGESFVYFAAKFPAKP